MNLLNTAQMAEIERHDFMEHVRHRYANRTRFYKYLSPFGQDMEIHTVACKTSKSCIETKEIIRASVDDPFVYVRDVAFHGMAGYCVDWHREGCGPQRPWDYRGKWESAAYSRTSGMWKLDRPVINPQVLQQSTRFRYCAWTPECGDILDYLKVYAKHPRIELLAKSGVGKFGCRISFVKQLESDKSLARFFMAHLDEIKRLGYGCDVIRSAFRRGLSLQESDRRIGDRRHFRPFRLPESVDASKALAYCQRKPGGEYRFCEYLRNCVKLGLDLSDTKVSFPRDFEHRSHVIADRIAEMKRREDIELAKKLDAQIQAVAKRFVRLERARAFRVLLPRKTSDLVREGKRLRNCLGDGHYAAKMARGETIVAFVRRKLNPSVSFVAAEFCPADGRVLQCYASKNQKPPKPVIDFVNQYFAKWGKAAAPETGVPHAPR